MVRASVACRRMPHFMCANKLIVIYFVILISSFSYGTYGIYVSWWNACVRVRHGIED